VIKELMRAKEEIEMLMQHKEYLIKENSLLNDTVFELHSKIYDKPIYSNLNPRIRIQPTSCERHQVDSHRLGQV
jgi:hypothetical protein